MAPPRDTSGERGRLRRRQTRSHRNLTANEEAELVERLQRQNRVMARVDGMYRVRARERQITEGTTEAAQLYRECRRTVASIMRADGTYASYPRKRRARE